MIRKYCNEIFPRRLWVVRLADIPEVCRKFAAADGSELTLDLFCDVSAKSVRCFERDSGESGYLVFVNRDQIMESVVSTIAHEASHCAVWLCADLGIGVSDSDSEAFSYIVGYYAGRINDAIAEPYEVRSV